MERIVHQSKYAIAKFDDNTKVYTLVYLPETEFMRDHEWKSLMEEFLIVTQDLKPVYIIDDNSQRLYAYPPEIQQWTLELFIDSWNKNGLKKYVQILPKDFIGTLSGEQIVELANIKFSEIFQNTFVTSMEQAHAWIKAD